MLGEILRALGEFFQSLLSMLGLQATPMAIGPNVLRVYIKSGGRTLQVDLNYQWSIRKVKEIVAPKLGCSPEEIKIIFSGTELPDDFILESCNVGQQSYLHAVRVQINQATKENLPTKIEETLIDSSSASSSRTTSQVESYQLEGKSRTGESESEIFSHDPVVNSGSHYFVYCNACEDMSEGKLRVRCATCLSGAFTVLRHPERWDDVMLPKQVEGVCSTPECEGNFAQFYFKCSGHVTSGEDDSSPPLPLVRRNSESVPCLACGDSKDPALVFDCPSTHVTCIDCFKQYAFLKIDQRQFVQDQQLGYTLGCPALCENSLIKDSNHFKIMGKYQYDRYQRFATEECVFQMGGILCPQPDCGMGIIPLESNCNKIACLHGCGFVFCRRCLEGWHLGECRPDSVPSTSSGSMNGFGYSVQLERAAQAQWDDVTRRALRMSTKPCPNCRVATERSGGCMHMECTKCKFSWCWICQTTWNRECMGNHWFG